MLELRGLHFHYARDPARPVISGIDLAVSAGEIVALLGPNGSGKSTLLSLAAGMLVPQRGEVRLDGKPLAGLARREVAHSIASVSQSGDLRFPLRAIEYVVTGCYARVGGIGFDSPREIEIALRALRDTDAEQFAERQVNELSTGERQRVALARALAQEPRFMLLDEPTANADPAHQFLLMQRIREVVDQRGLGAIIVTHDINLAAEFADRLVLLKDGRLMADGRASAVMTESLLSRIFGIPLHIDRHPRSDRPRVSWVRPGNN